MENIVHYDSLCSGGVFLNLNLMLSFVAVVDHQSLTKAARQLHLTQPAVTKHIQALEELFAVRLIERADQAKPTPEGEILYRHAKTILETLENAHTEIDILTDSLQGRLTIGASTIPGQYLMPKILGLFNSVYPKTEISLEISDTAQVINKVLDDEVLVGAIGAEIRNPKLFCKEFYRDSLVFIAPPLSPFSLKTQFTIHELSSMPFIWREKGSGTRKFAEELLKKASFNIANLNIIMELNSSEAIITAVEAGLGISLISKCAAQRALQSGSLRELKLEGVLLERQLYLITLRNNLKRKLVIAFLETVDTFTKN